jgi:hypothetical protein
MALQLYYDRNEKICHSWPNCPVGQLISADRRVEGCDAAIPMCDWCDNRTAAHKDAEKRSGFGRKKRR